MSNKYYYFHWLNPCTVHHNTWLFCGFCSKVIFFVICPTKICLAFSTRFPPSCWSSLSNNHVKIFSPHGVRRIFTVYSTTERYNITLAWKHPGFVIPRHPLVEERKRGSAASVKKRAEKTIQGSYTITQPCHIFTSIVVPFTFELLLFLIEELFRRPYTRDAAGSSRESGVGPGPLPLTCPWRSLQVCKAETGITCTGWC